MKRIFHEHYLKVQAQHALDKAEKKKRKLESHDFTSPSLSSSSKQYRPRSRTSCSSESNGEDNCSTPTGAQSVFEATNAAMQEICLNLKAKRLQSGAACGATLSTKERVDLLQYLSTHGTEEQKNACIAELFKIAGL